jgi:hypothetical protein
MKTNYKSVFRVGLTVCVPVLATVMTSQGVMATEYPVTVYFEKNGCPELSAPVATPTVDANGADKVIWKGVYREDNKPVTTGYKIYFDPFQGGKPLKSGADGKIISNPVDTKTPKGVDFKYTIVGDPEVCLSAPKDPIIRVRY